MSEDKIDQFDGEIYDIHFWNAYYESGNAPKCTPERPCVIHSSPELEECEEWLKTK